MDANQAEIVRELRARGYSVKSLAAVGKGVPDLLVGRTMKNALLEVKDGSLPPSRRKLTEEEQQFHWYWRGQSAVVSTLQEALAALDKAGL